MIKVSIVIRILNECENLRKLLEILSGQDYPREKVEVIVVDNESVDSTVAVAQQYGAKVITIKKSEFSYPKAMNMGVAASRGSVVVFLSAHSFPFSKDWLRSGMRHFENAAVAGVFSVTRPLDGATLADKVFYVPGYWWTKMLGVVKVRRAYMGVLGATNAAIRRSLWEKRPFDERYAGGGEDTEWASWALASGYEIIRDPKFAVKHSHNLSFVGLLKQIQYWRSTSAPQQFSRSKLSFRNRFKD